MDLATASSLLSVSFCDILKSKNGKRRQHIMSTNPETVNPRYLIALRENPKTSAWFYQTVQDCINEVKPSNIPFMGKAVLNAYLNGDKEDLLTALTGWSMSSLIRMVEDKAKAEYESINVETESEKSQINSEKL
jgi:hypothetical protein